jgi:hypothetical protein
MIQCGLLVKMFGFLYHGMVLHGQWGFAQEMTNHQDKKA